MTAYLLLAALSMSLGWGIRGQFGHEYGAAMAGVLGGLPVAMLSGREDWLRRFPYFALLGAVGWSFGGSMSYMQVVAYAHSEQPATLLYGFACLWVLGFLWASMGGAGVAIAASFDRESLSSLVKVILVVLASWYLQDLWIDDLEFRLGQPLPELYDSDWLAPISAVMGVAGYAAVRRKWTVAHTLVVWLAAGWWAGFGGLVLGLGWRMTPPRGDNWAGVAGMTAAVFLFFAWRGMREANLATIASGVAGGVAFSLGHLIKLACIATGLNTNWHSVMEQTQGFLFGLGLALAFALVGDRIPKTVDEPDSREWTRFASIVLVLLGLIYVNFRKSPAEWMKYVTSMDGPLYGLPPAGWLLPSRGWIGWMELFYIAALILLWRLWRRHLRQPLAAVPAAWEGRAQLLFLAVLWSEVAINTLHVIVRFSAQRIVTEWVIAMDAVICTGIVLLAMPVGGVVSIGSQRSMGGHVRRLLLLGASSIIILTGFGSTLRWALFGDQPTGFAERHYRFRSDGATVER